MVTVVVVALGVAALLVLLFGYARFYDSRAARHAGDNFGAAAGVHIEPLRQSTLLDDRLGTVHWNAAKRVGINPGRVVVDVRGVHWMPSILTGRKVPPFSVEWAEIARFHVAPGPKITGRQVAQVTLELVDGSPVRFASYDPAGWTAALTRDSGPS